MDLFFVFNYVLAYAPNFVNIVAVLLGFAYTIYGKIKQCQVFAKLKKNIYSNKSYFLNMYTGLTAITNAVFAKTKELSRKRDIKSLAQYQV